MEVEVDWPMTLEMKYFQSDEDEEFGFRVLLQNDFYTVQVKAFEDYSYDIFTRKTYLDNCDITINDEVGPLGTTESAFADTTIYYYTFAPYLPVLLAGGDHPYQNMLEVTVTDNELDRTATQTDWVLIEGAKPQETTFASTSPEIPFLVLHDPPGDKSYTAFKQSSSHSIAMSMSAQYQDEQNSFINIHMAPDIVQNIGLFYSSQIEIDNTADLNLGWSYTSQQRDERETMMTFTTSEEYRTSDEEQLIGRESDVFVGGAINLLWGLTKELAWDDSTNNVVLTDNIMVSPDGFATIYVYTESQIRLNVIPNLEAIGDTTSIAMWESYLAMNEDNIANAEVNPNHPGNLSFSAGTGYTYEETTTNNSSHTVYFDSTISMEMGMVLGSTLNGMGIEGGFTFHTAMTFGQSTTDTYETESTVTYVLADDDETSSLNYEADYFTVDIKTDPVYGTPVFNLLGGSSSNRWEQNTLPRDAVTFTANTYTANDLQEGEEAAFLLYLGNESQTDEDRRYYLTMHHESNPGGATVKINGFPLTNAIPIDVPPHEQVQVVMTVAQGPTEYEYNDLTLEFYAQGDRGNQAPDGYNFYIYKSFDVSWEQPYSKVNIFAPANDWIINAASEDTLEIIFNDYDISKPDFESIILKYKRPWEVNWQPITEIYRSELESHPLYYEYRWGVGSIPDGQYQIVACATDSLLSDYYCDPLLGTIDRTIPDVIGIPQPSDGILSLGDEISIYFTEWIDHEAVNPIETTLTINRTGALIDIDIDCYENKVQLVPRWSNYNFENETLTARVAGIRDLFGNVVEDELEWEFYVNANPVFWDTPKLELIKPLGESMTVTAHLLNTGGQFSTWELDNDMPEWLTASVYSGSLLPLDSETINFTISNELSFGTFIDTVWVDVTSLGREPLIFEVSVLANPPAWAATQLNIYDYSMTITGQLYMEGETSTDTNDIIGAFIINEDNDYECRGYASLQRVPYFDNTYQFYLTVNSNEEEGEELIFRVWDNSTSKEHIGVTEQFTFMSGGIYGTAVTPELLHVSSNLIRTISCRSGWNWVSVNLINPASMGLDTILSTLSPQSNDIIKNQTSYAQYATGLGWIGNMSEVPTTETVKIKLAQPDELQIIGTLEDMSTTPITYGSGWNWIGYLPHFSFSVNQALANISNAVTGDLVKSQNGYAQYIDGYGWYGSLLFMDAGKGYMLSTANAGSFTYPDNTAIRSEAELTSQRLATPYTRDLPGWTVNPLEYEYSSNVTAVVNYNGEVLNTQNAMLAAFYGDECRGIASAVNVLDQWTFFLTQYSNNLNEYLTYKVYVAEDDVQTTLEESLRFVNNQILGNPLNPYIFNTPLASLSVPQNVSLSLSPGQLALSWDAVSNAVSYKVLASDSPNGTYSEVTTSGSFGVQNRAVKASGIDLSASKAVPISRNSRERIIWTCTTPAIRQQFYKILASTDER
ncbi:MAG: hypothetical protein JXR56_05030 [Candidatus Cloacimonetes bacterium]|nr:hypothetical protein [Candidatus Cloacimonadota bacterium]